MDGLRAGASVALIGAALIIEHLRANPLINTRWLGTRELVRLMLVAASVANTALGTGLGSVGLLNIVVCSTIR